MNSERGSIHSVTIEQARNHLKSVYEDKFDYQQFAESKTNISESLNEAEPKSSIRQHLIKILPEENQSVPTYKNKKTSDNP